MSPVLSKASLLSPLRCFGCLRVTSFGVDASQKLCLCLLPHGLPDSFDAFYVPHPYTCCCRGCCLSPDCPFLTVSLWICLPPFRKISVAFSVSPSDCPPVSLCLSESLWPSVFIHRRQETATFHRMATTTPSTWWWGFPVSYSLPSSGHLKSRYCVSPPDIRSPRLPLFLIVHLTWLHILSCCLRRWTPNGGYFLLYLACLTLLTGACLSLLSHFSACVSSCRTPPHYLCPVLFSLVTLRVSTYLPLSFS